MSEQLTAKVAAILLVAFSIFTYTPPLSGSANPFSLKIARNGSNAITAMSIAIGPNCPQAAHTIPVVYKTLPSRSFPATEVD